MGAIYENSSSSGINSISDNGAVNAGAAYVFSRSGNSWTEQNYIKASNTGADDRFSQSLSLSSDGNALAVGGQFPNSVPSVSGGHRRNPFGFVHGQIRSCETGF